VKRAVGAAGGIEALRAALDFLDEIREGLQP